MMRLGSQSHEIEKEIMKCLNNKMTDKMEIISWVVESLGVPRPTVRRVKAAILEKLKSHVKVLT